MTCIETELEEPEFWTILKTPYLPARNMHPRTVHMISCDGFSSAYSCYVPSVSLMQLVTVKATLNNAAIDNNEYSVTVTNFTVYVLFTTPPPVGAVITIYST